MELAAQSFATPAARPVLRPWQVETTVAWLIGFVPVSYLALSGGGFDIVTRSEVGVLVWWGLLLGALVGVVPRTRWTWAGWTAAALLTGFLAWTWIATGWTQSEERTLVEVSRLATYVGVLVLGLCLVTRANVSSLLNGVACAVLLVSSLAVLSRIQPSWFPPPPAQSVYPTVRLAYPFDYADGVGEFAALGLPLLLFVATSARTRIGRSLAAAGLPVVALCVALTVSRGGVLACAVGLIVFFALAPDRLPRLATAAVAAVATAVPVATLLRHPGERAALLLQCFGERAPQAARGHPAVLRRRRGRAARDHARRSLRDSAAFSAVLAPPGTGRHRCIGGHGSGPGRCRSGQRGRTASVGRVQAA